MILITGANGHLGSQTIDFLLDKKPEGQIAMSVMTAQTFVNGALDVSYDDMEQLLGHNPTGLETFISEFVNQ